MFPLGDDIRNSAPVVTVVLSVLLASNQTAKRREAGRLTNETPGGT
jgi:hypothetical protein